MRFQILPHPRTREWVVSSLPPDQAEIQVFREIKEAALYRRIRTNCAKVYPEQRTARMKAHNFYAAT